MSEPGALLRDSQLDQEKGPRLAGSIYFWHGLARKGSYRTLKEERRNRAPRRELAQGCAGSRPRTEPSLWRWPNRVTKPNSPNLSSRALHPGLFPTPILPNNISLAPRKCSCSSLASSELIVCRCSFQPTLPIHGFHGGLC